MSIFKKSFLACMLALAASTSAMAADMAEPMPVAEAIPIVEEAEMGSNWYLRGDVGYALWGEVRTDASWITGSDITGHEASENFSAGFGAGYNFGWIRADITLDYFAPSTYTGRTSGTCSNATGSCSSVEESSVETFASLVNAYFDLGTWSGITPYIGGGVGMAQVNWDKWTTAETCVATGAQTCPQYHNAAASPTTSTYSYSNTGNSQIRLAYAAMAGLSYEMTKNMSIDVGYRYMVIDNGKAVSSYLGGAGTAVGSIDYTNLYTHEVRVGFRYLID